MPHKTAHPNGTLFNYNQTKDLEASFIFPLFSLQVSLQENHIQIWNPKTQIAITRYSLPLSLPLSVLYVGIQV